MQLHDHKAFVDDLLSRKRLNEKPFFMEIGPNDEMYYQAILPGTAGNVGLATFRYFDSATRTFDIYKQLAEHLGGFSNLGPVLDFGSGWGRLTRCLLQKIPQEKIWVSDIYSNAVGWQAEKLGVVGVVSVSDPAYYGLTQKFSIILAGSVFTHLPHDLFQRWLKKLYSLLLPNGVLAFSVSDESWLQAGDLAGATVGVDGSAFFEVSESQSLDKKKYGAMYIRDTYVADSVRALGGSGNINFKLFKGALYENQDLCIVAGRDVDISGLDLAITPIGGTTAVARENEMASVGVWGIDLNKGHSLSTATLFIDGRGVETKGPTGSYPGAKAFFPGSPNEAVCWTFQFSDPVNESIRVEINSSSGTMTQAYVSPIDMSCRT